ncbi:MOSC-domain-containing protein [Schizopora paradoxa]|uniref:MOSC-domain-containing protein n=1 Tax=Schizopora paradoxa TaxID=27342 RepID=A0A0H2SSQ1_9AGAM|nr:MOSC-domain-containing protein [Schizopora paradoxa]
MQRFADVKVTKILVHPIKSCRGTSVSQSRYDKFGLEFDRRFAIIDAETHEVITARTHPKMVLIHPTIEEDNRDENAGTLAISFPSDSDCQSFKIPLLPCPRLLSEWQTLGDVKLWGREDIDGHICQTVNSCTENTPSKTISKYLGREVLLVAKGQKARPCHATFDFPTLKATAMYQDGYPLLIASEESLVSVQERMMSEVGKQSVSDRWAEDQLVMERFRPNIVMQGAGIPWAEDLWETIQIGGNTSTICLVSKCTRCLLPNVDPDTGIRDKAVPFKILMKFRTGKDPARLKQPCFGCNAVPSGSGVVRVGDPVHVLSLLPPA